MKNIKINITKTLVVALTLSLATFINIITLPGATTKAAFTPGTVLINEQFDTPTDMTTGTPSGLGALTTDFGIAYNVPPLYEGIYKEGRYQVMPAGTTPNSKHSAWLAAPIDGTGYFAANLQGYVAGGSNAAIFSVPVTLTAGKTYRFEMQGASALDSSKGVLPRIGLEVAGTIVDNTGTIGTTPKNIIVEFIATTSGPQTLKIISFESENSGNDLLINYVKLTEGVSTPNKPPVAVDDINTTPVDTMIQLNPLNNDTDPDGDFMDITEINGTVITVGTAQTIIVPNGKVVVDIVGGIFFYPDAGFNGLATFPYKITDNNGEFVTANQKITVGTPVVNKFPVAVDDVYTTPFGVSKILVPLDNDTDPDNDLFDFKSINGVAIAIPAGAFQVIPTADGSIEIDATGLVAFTPKAGFSGITNIPYEISDGKGGTATANIKITVDPKPNTPPVAVDDTYTTALETAVTLNPKTNDTDADSDPLSVSSIGGTAVTPGTAQSITVPEGIVAIDAAGVIKFTPKTGFSGPVKIAYIISDGKGGTAPANINITVTAKPNNPPVAVDDTYTTNFNTPVVLTPLTADTDANTSDVLVVTKIGGTTITPGTAQSIPTTNGKVDITAAGVMTFTPTPGYVGTEAIAYEISDGQGGTDIGSESITVKPKVNTPPVATDDVYTVGFEGNVTLSPLDLDTDADGDTLSVTKIGGTVVAPIVPGTNQVIPVTDGTVTINGSLGSITFTPKAGFSGPTSILYEISDGKGGMSTAKELITVKKSNTSPVAIDDLYTTPFNTPIVVTPVTNDTDADGDKLIVDVLDGIVFVNSSTVNVPNGTIDIDAVGVMTFKPTPGFVGTTNIPYFVNDGFGGVTAGKIIVTVKAAVVGANNPPVAVDDTYTTAFETAVTLTPKTNDTDADSDPLSVSSIGGTAVTPGTAQSITVPEGIVAIDAAGVIKFTPKTGFSGPVKIAYIISDGKGGTAPANINITVTAKPNNPPVAVDDTYTTAFETAVTLTPKTNDTDADSDPLVVSSIGGTAVTPGTAQSIIVPEGIVAIDAAGVIKFTPKTGFSGPVKIAYIISDGKGGTAPAFVNVTVAAIVVTNTPPVAVNDNYTTLKNNSIVLNPKALDTDVDNDMLTINQIGGTYITPGVAQTIFVMNGEIKIDTAGVITFYPATDYVGTISFQYTLTDGKVNSNLAYEFIEVKASLPLDATIKGKIFIDLNGNGLQDANEPDGGLPTYIGTNAMTISQAGGFYASYIVNVDGTYEIKVPKGNYELNFYGLFEYKITGVIAGTSITVLGGETKDIGKTGLVKKVEITGVVFNDTNKNGIKDPSETFAYDVLIQIRDQVTNGIISGGYTDANGKYSFLVDPVVSGSAISYLLSYETPDGYEYSIPDTQTITVSAGDTVKQAVIAPLVEIPNPTPIPVTPSIPTVITVKNGVPRTGAPSTSLILFTLINLSLLAFAVYLKSKDLNEIKR
jgi:Bacterial Ig domain/SdrD B-like domain